jgi:hypothetical protein
MKPSSLEDYIEHADDLAQEVVNAWGINARAGNAATLTRDFKALFEIAASIGQPGKPPTTIVSSIS